MNMYNSKYTFFYISNEAFTVYHIYLKLTSFNISSEYERCTKKIDHIYIYYTTSFFRIKAVLNFSA
jgi:hypothetical protein